MKRLICIVALMITMMICPAVRADAKVAVIPRGGLDECDWVIDDAIVVDGKEYNIDAQFHKDEESGKAQIVAVRLNDKKQKLKYLLETDCKLDEPSLSEIEKEMRMNSNISISDGLIHIAIFKSDDLGYDNVVAIEIHDTADLEFGCPWDGYRFYFQIQKGKLKYLGQIQYVRDERGYDCVDANKKAGKLHITEPMYSVFGPFHVTYDCKAKKVGNRLIFDSKPKTCEMSYYYDYDADLKKIDGISIYSDRELNEKIGEIDSSKQIKFMKYDFDAKFYVKNGSIKGWIEAGKYDWDDYRTFKIIFGGWN